MVRVTHDHNTLDKVVVGLKTVGLPDAIITEAINAMHNEGILFRERAEEGEAIEWDIDANRPMSETVAAEKAEDQSNLVQHARRELTLIGEDKDVIDWYCRTIAAFASFGHSGGSHAATLPVLTELLQFNNLSPLTDDPEEWVKHDEDIWPPNGIWQSARNAKAFSENEGKNYYLVDEVEDGKKIFYATIEKGTL